MIIKKFSLYLQKNNPKIIIYMENIKELTKGEKQIMQVLWSINQGFAHEIMEAFPEPKPAYNTMLTMIRILEKKGFVKHETFCKANRYMPIISKKEYSKVCLDNFVRDFFNNSYTGLVSAFVKRENLSMEELEEIKKTIDDAIQEENAKKS